MQTTRDRNMKRKLFAALAALSALSAQAQEKPWEVGAVLDVGHTSHELALGQRAQGLALGHSDVMARGPLGQHFSAQLSAAAHQEGSKVEAELEEAWVQTRGLPGGFQARAGRFSSQIGYLNEQHPHADDFTERPLLYRAFLGGHWFDDGLRLNWTAPTPFYLTVGTEVFRGRQLVEEAASSRNPGAITLSMKAGNDIGISQSWQLGASYLHNRREAAIEEDHEEEANGHEEHGHSHSHGAFLSGERMWMLDAAWKWAPEGNNRQQQLKLIGEYARVTDPNRYADRSDYHEALSLSAVWRLSQEWEVGARTDWLKAKLPHEDHFDDAKLREHALMLAWKPSHMQTLRLQFTIQPRAEGFEDRSNRTVQLQYVLSFGAHSAHSF
jgi:hypothetical protein